MTTRKEQIIKGPRSYWGTEHSGIGPVMGEPDLHLGYCDKEGVLTANVYERPFTGAVAVVQHTAVVINGRGKPIPTTKTVICRLHSTELSSFLRLRTGRPVEVIDPGREHQVFVLPWSTKNDPLVPKDTCRNIRPCSYTNEKCGNCCNNKKKLNGSR